MSSQCNPQLANVFVKNLDKAIDDMAIYDTFSAFGNILSCKVATDEMGNSKGYGFVEFETVAAANTSIDKVNGILLNGKKISVSKFIPRKEREKNELFTNVYIKNFTDDFDEEKLKELFEPFGKITSYKVMSKDDGKNKGFGFVAYETPEAAESAVKALNGKDMGEGKLLYVDRAQKKDERKEELKCKYREIEKKESVTGVNLYVKNLHDSIDDQKLKELFEPYGKITSYKIMYKDDGKSKGFGFVAYETPEAAESAVQALNGKDMGEGKTLYVARAQKKAERKQELKCKYREIEKKESVTGVNLYVKNLHDSIDDQKLKELFEPYGKITSYKIMYKDDGKSKGFGFVAYETPEAAESAVQALNGKDMGEGKTLYVARAQKKAERKQELKCKYREIEKKESVTGVNLYVKNLHDSIDDQKLNELFEPYGKITSCKVMVKNDGKSKGYGFVAYETTEAADAAI